MLTRFVWKIMKDGLAVDIMNIPTSQTWTIEQGFEYDFLFMLVLESRDRSEATIFYTDLARRAHWSSFCKMFPDPANRSCLMFVYHHRFFLS